MVALLVVAVSFCPCDGKGDHCGGQAPRGNVVSPILASGTQQFVTAANRSKDRWKFSACVYIQWSAVIECLNTSFPDNLYIGTISLLLFQSDFQDRALCSNVPLVHVINFLAWHMCSAINTKYFNIDFNLLIILQIITRNPVIQTCSFRFVQNTIRQTQYTGSTSHLF